MTSLKEYATFFREFRQRFETTGAIAPSSRFLARSMTRYLRARPAEAPPVRVLEIGPGTGAVTGTIVKHIRANDRFDLVELNEAFASHLQQKFKTDRVWQRLANQSQVHVAPLQEFSSDGPYDFVISGLPLNNFPADLVDDIFEHYFKHLLPGGVLSYFEYQFVRSFRTRVGAKSERARLKQIDETMGRYCSKHRIRRDWVFPNLPPAWVQHLQKSRE
ncbi:MAG: methyltransferase domain-containing protein [Planctomycetota bacterium]|nr:methyltransferase domain-containing protein [Planctomycetota bacterium]